MIFVGILIDEIAQVLKVLVDHVQQEQIFVFEMIGDRALGYADFICDLLEGCIVVAIIVEHFFGRGENLRFDKRRFIFHGQARFLISTLEL